MHESFNLQPSPTPQRHNHPGPRAACTSMVSPQRALSFAGQSGTHEKLLKHSIVQGQVV